MTFSEWIDLATILVSISLGLLAWEQTNRQIKLSNKHTFHPPGKIILTTGKKSFICILRNFWQLELKLTLTCCMSR